MTFTTRFTASSAERNRGLSRLTATRARLCLTGAALLASGLVMFAPPVQAQECSDATLEGRYSYGRDHTSNFIFPLEAEGDFHGAQVGFMTFDGMGTVDEVNDLSVGDSPTTSEIRVIPFNLADFPAWRGEYAVAPDCTGTITFFLPDGRIPFSMSFVVASDGEEIYALNDFQFEGRIGIFWMKRMGSAAALKGQVADLEAKVDALQALLERVAARNGLVP